MLPNLQVIVFLVIVTLMPVIAENALSDEEIQILQANGYNITVNEEDNTITVDHHGLPDHTSDGGWGNNNDARKVNHSYTLKLKPTIAEEKGCASGLGVIGLAISGGAFYNPYTAFGWNAVEGECAEDLDDCQGHPSPDYTYHYHGIPKCLYTGDLRDKFLGVALDGYPIYGPMDSDGQNWTTSKLDECHGHYYKGRYIYRATYEFPYILSCFYGEKVDNGNMGPTGNQRPPPPGNANNNNGMPMRPPGTENDPCWTAKYANWQDSCRVTCMNPGNEECTTETDSATSNSAYSVYILTLFYVLFISL